MTPLSKTNCQKQGPHRQRHLLITVASIRDLSKFLACSILGPDFLASVNIGSSPLSTMRLLGADRGRASGVTPREKRLTGSVAAKNGIS